MPTSPHARVATSQPPTVVDEVEDVVVLLGAAAEDGRLRVIGAASPLCDPLRMDAAPLPRSR